MLKVVLDLLIYVKCCGTVLRLGFQKASYYNLVKRGAIFTPSQLLMVIFGQIIFSRRKIVGVNCHYSLMFKSALAQP